MTKFILRIQFLLTAFFVLAVSGFAQQVNSEIVLYKVTTDAEGREQLVEADSVQQNDLLEYQLIYNNTGSTAITSLKAVLPVPKEMKLIMPENQAEAFTPKVSLNSTSWSAYPIMEEAPGSDPLKKPVDERLYRFLQWNIATLEPGSQHILKARMRVL
ncbi:MAG: hypothetical protein MK198_03570 [Gracilimonas sp.]|uniref:hypothetical protein n=1 Tax=Gracilimonas sp. TaxID=1974203 RepID=UPI0037538C29|nr:hypothetical protein [Gracilimonas sp.]